MGRINRIPLGFLNLLGTQTGGKNPSESAETVLPTISMDPFYLAHRIEGRSLSFSYSAPAQSFTLDVPADESWLLYTASAFQGFTLIGDMLDLSLNLNRTAGGGALGNIGIGNFRLEFDGSAGVANESMTDTIQFPVPLPLLSGTRLQARVNYFNAPTARNCVVTFLVAVLKG